MGQHDTSAGPAGNCGETRTLPVMKGIFPFRLGTTSYILPASVIPNIRFLGPFLDEIEIILFESKGEGSLPARAEIDEMRLLAEEFDLVYNVHLPTDVFLGDADPQLRERARQTILRFIDRTSRLDPTVFILHSEEGSNADVRKNTDRNAWMSRMVESLEKLVREGADPRQLALENIVYTPETIFPLAEHLGMSLCLDIGHLLRCGHSVQDQIRQLSGKVSMVHLHGVREGRDHSGIQFIPQDEWNSIYQALRGDFTGGVSLEVFSLEDLIPSLQRIRECL